MLQASAPPIARDKHGMRVGLRGERFEGISLHGGRRLDELELKSQAHALGKDQATENLVTLINEMVGVLAAYPFIKEQQRRKKWGWLGCPALMPWMTSEDNMLKPQPPWPCEKCRNKNGTHGRTPCHGEIWQEYCDEPCTLQLAQLRAALRHARQLYLSAVPPPDTDVVLSTDAERLQSSQPSIRYNMGTYRRLKIEPRYGLDLPERMFPWCVGLTETSVGPMGQSTLIRRVELIE